MYTLDYESFFNVSRQKSKDHEKKDTVREEILKKKGVVLPCNEHMNV